MCSHRNREQSSGCQGLGAGEMGESGQKVQTSTYKMSKLISGDVQYSRVTTMNNAVLYIWRILNYMKWLITYCKNIFAMYKYVK